MTAILTGASGGIGHELARVLAAAGHALTLTGRDPRRLAQAADAARAHGVEAQACTGDLRDPTFRADLVTRHLAEHGGLDVLVANAGAGRAAPVAASDDRTVADAWERNVAPTFGLVRDALPALTAPGGMVVITASVAGLHPTRGVAAYSAAKAALVSLARSVNLEHAAAGVRACALCPGYVDTPMATWVHDRVPPAEMVRPADVGAALRFLLSLSPTAVVDELVIRRATAPPTEP